jgi:hypothetical protein
MKRTQITMIAMIVAVVTALNGCSKEPKVRIAHGEDKHLILKSDLLIGASSVDAYSPSAASLLERAKADGLTKVEMELSESFVTVWEGSKADGVAKYQFPVKGHYDLARDKDKEGRENQYLIKTQDLNKSWNDRLYVQVDPAELKLVKADEKVTSLLHDVKALSSKTYVVGKDAIPGLNERLLNDLNRKVGLADGDVVSIQLSKSSARYFKQNADGTKTLVASVPVAYFDLVRSKNEKEELTNAFERSTKNNSWDKRSFVEITPDSVEATSNDVSLVKKDSLNGCQKVSEVSVPELKDFLSSRRVSIEENDTVCFEVTQTQLSVCRDTCTVDGNLLATFDVVDHLDLNVADDSGAVSTSKKNLWNDREWIRIVSSNPQPVENHVGSNVMKRSAFDGEFVYVETVVASHSENGEAFEGATMSTDNRLKFEISEGAISAIKLDEALNTAGTKTPILRFAADHFSVERVKNSYGDGTNAIGEVRDRPWADRKNVRVGFGKNQIEGFFNSTLGLNNMYFQNYIVTDSRQVGDVRIHSDGMISYETETVLTPNAQAGNFGAGETGLEPVTVVIRHAFVRVDQRQAKARMYDNYDFRRFGLFRHEKLGLDKSQRPKDDAVEQYGRIYDLSNGKKIEFFLNAGFPEQYKDEARAVIASWNKAFEAATGRADVVVLNEDVKDADFGDPRLNMIVYIDHRNVSAPLGYGPGVSDPKTGEIISAKSYLYGDAVRWVRDVTGDYYDYLTGDKTEEAFEEEGRISLPSLAPELLVGNNLVQKPSGSNLIELKSVAKQGLQTNYAQALKRIDSFSAPATKGAAANYIGDAMSKLRVAQQGAPLASAINHHNHAHDANNGCVMRAEEHLVSAGRFVAMQKQAQLSREEILEKMESSIVYTTLLHEVGHNFGLRHNFQGSFDELNFHPEYFEIKAKLAGENAEGVESKDSYLEMYKTSSIMDYNDMFEATAEAAGPYDMAAIKYAYGNKIEVIDEAASQAAGKLVTTDLDVNVHKAAVAKAMIENPGVSRLSAEFFVDRQLNVRQYMFCTDDHVGNDPTCNRFDSGITMEEVITNLVDGYDLSYTLNAFRRGRRDFTGNANGVISRYILPVRQMLDEWVYGLVTGSQQEAGPAGANDYLAAVNVGLRFFMKVLQTPEPGTYVLNKEKGMYEVGTAKEGEQALSVGLNVGKYLESTSETIGDKERVLRRGIELDKAAVMMALSMRGFPADKYQRASISVNYFDVAKNLTLDIFTKVMLDAQEASVNVADVEGTLIAVTPAQAESLRGNEKIKISQAKIKPSSNLFIETYAMIFAMMDFNNASNKTFGDYVDFRIKGDDDKTIPSGVERVSFIGANGLQTYIVPQTRDGKSISFEIAKNAGTISKELEAASKLSKSKSVQASIAAQSEALFPAAVAGMKEVLKSIGADEPSAEQIAAWEADKTAAVGEILESITGIKGQATTILEQATAAGNKRAIERMTAILAAIDVQLAAMVCPAPAAGAQAQECSLASLQKLQADVKAATEKVDDLSREISQIESKLIQMRSMYRALN